MEILYLVTILLVLAMWMFMHISRKRKNRKWGVVGLIFGGLGVILALVGLLVSCSFL